MLERCLLLLCVPTYSVWYWIVRKCIQSHLNKLAKLNNKLLRAAQIKNRRYPVSELYIAYNTLPILYLYAQRLLLFVHKFVHHCESLPDVFCDYFVFNNAVTLEVPISYMWLVLEPLLVVVLLSITAAHYGTVCHMNCNSQSVRVFSKLK